MRHQCRYVALLDGYHEDAKPLAVLRIRDDVEEIHVPGRGWERADPRWRDWLVNVPIDSGRALGLMGSLAPTGPLEELDPYPHALGRDAAEGFGTQWFYYAVETPDHPLDDPLTLVKLHYPSRSESWFTADLRWADAPVPGRRVRITQEELERLERVLIRRAFGGAEVEHYAILNPFHPDLEHPAAIVRVDPDGEQRYLQDGEWASTSVVFQIRHRFRHGTLVPLTEEAAARLVERWRPHPDGARVRYYAWTTDGRPTSVMRAWDDDGGIVEESYKDGQWTGREKCVFDDERQRVELDRVAAERLGKRLDQRDDGPVPEDGRYRYHAILVRERDDVSTAHGLVRTWGGGNGLAYEEKFNPRIDRWRRTMTVYEIMTARDDDYAVPISEDVAKALRRILLADFTAGSEGRGPERPGLLGKWAGFGKVTLSRIDDGQLDALRQVGDPPADAAIAEVYGLGVVDRVNELLAGLVRNGDKVPKRLPPSLRHYFAESAALPDWADRALLARGQDLWDRFASHLAASLCCYVLPVRHGMAQRLHHTRRGMESTRLLQDVLAGGGLLNRHGRGLRRVQKIRLLNAATRRHAGSDGVAANQEALAATVGTLSVHLAQGMWSLCVVLDEGDRDALFHIWSVVGHLLGVDAMLLPDTYDDAVTLMDKISRRGRRRSAVGSELAVELQQRISDALPHGLKNASADLIRSFCLLDSELPDLLGVREVALSEALGYLEPIAAAAGLPAGSINDDRVWRRTTSGVVGKALLAADRDEDLALPR